MKILVTIANFGTKNDGYLKRLLDEYRSMSHQVHVVALTNAPKDLGPDVEVAVLPVPARDPWEFPFPHKKILADRIADYDLFIYSEDDTLITQRNIDAFLCVTECLPADRIAGFMRSEKGPDGSLHFSTVHGPYHWDARSVLRAGEYTFAHFTNEHSACYVLTRAQLQRAIASGGFLVEPHHEKYDLLVTAATDPYTQCGFRKMVCVSHIDDFVLPHLPNKYVGKLGTSEADIRRQIVALMKIGDGTHPCTVLLDSETTLYQAKASKYYVEPCRDDLVAMVGDSAREVLSYGCGIGITEGELVAKGMRVTGVPLDSVIGACAAARGVEVRYDDPELVLAKLQDRRFDCILIADVLHLVPDPEGLLHKLGELLSPDGVFVASLPNLSRLPALWNRFNHKQGFERLCSFEQSGTHVTSTRVLKRWFGRSGLKIRELELDIPKRAKWAHRVSGKLLGDAFASSFLLVAAKLPQ
jgi:2-polyprenyl-3-methyl-5-hydroxy-6-metoxy-1,4-benzoquinol methylase